MLRWDSQLQCAGYPFSQIQKRGQETGGPNCAFPLLPGSLKVPCRGLLSLMQRRRARGCSGNQQSAGGGSVWTSPSLLIAFSKHTHTPLKAGSQQDQPYLPRSLDVSSSTTRTGRGELSACSEKRYWPRQTPWKICEEEREREHKKGELVLGHSVIRFRRKTNISLQSGKRDTVLAHAVPDRIGPLLLCRHS